MNETTSLEEHRKRGQSTDGEPDQNRRAHDDDAAHSIEDLADEETLTGEEDDGQLFVMESGKTTTLGTLIERGTPVHYEFKLDARAVKGADGMGLLSFADPEMTLVVPVRAGKVVADPTYNPDGSIKHVTIRAHVKPTMVYDARTEGAQVALHGE